MISRKAAQFNLLLMRTREQRINSQSTHRPARSIATILGILSICQFAQAQGPQGGNTHPLDLNQTVRRVLERNEAMQMRMLDVEISARVLKAEKGIFEPSVVASFDHLDSKKESTIQEQRSLLTSEFNQRNNIYDGGLEFLVPTGGRLKFGTSLRDLRNNLQSSITTSSNRLRHEYETFAGVSLTQPLLKNFGPNASTARIRLAALASDIAFQEYRRQQMLTVARTESAYWDLHLTQEQEQLSIESISLAGTILTNNRNRAAVGRMADLEVIQAQAGLSLRQARLSDARLKRLLASSQLTILFAEPGILTNVIVMATDLPAVRTEPLTYFDSFEQAFLLNPDYLSRKKAIQQENIKLAYAKNQRLPQLDLKASYGLNGLGLTPGDSYGDIDSQDRPAWSVGLEMRIPVTGGVKERNELAAAKLARQKALLGLKEVETQIGNALQVGIQKVQSAMANVTNYQSVVDFHAQLLKSQMERLDVGRIDSRTVLETEEKLFEARIAVADSMVQYRKALLELELSTGATLQVRNLDLTMLELKGRTESWAANLNWPASSLEHYAREAGRGDFQGDLRASEIIT